MKPNEKKERKPGKRKPTLKEKVREHLQDKNHVITDEDLRDIVIGPEAVDLDAQREKHPGEKIRNAAEDLKNELPENKKNTPWDILDEG
jgi:hypothetical protein